MHDPQWLQGDIEVLYDPGRDFALEQVVQPPLCAQFSLTRGTPAFGYERRGIWLRWRLTFPTGMAASPRLLVPHVGTERVCTHWPVLPRGYRSECGDIRDPLGVGPPAAQGWDFGVPATFDSSRPVLLYAQGPGDVQLPMQVGSARALLADHSVQKAWQGMFYGLLVGILLVGLVMFASQKDLTHLYFAIAIAMFALYVATHEGHLNALGVDARFTLWANLPAGAMSVLFGTLFYQRFLETRTYTPRLHRLLTITAVLAVMSALVLMLRASPGIPLITVTDLMWVLAMMVVIVVRLRQGARLAVYALMAWAVLLLADGFRLLEFQGMHLVDVPRASILYNVDILLHSGLILIGLLDRMHRLAQERDRANALALHRAQYDDLTRLANRHKFQEDLRALIGQEVHQPRRLALVTFGLDRFGAINHTLGYKAGDRVLQEITHQIQRCLPSGTLLARTGPDQFSWVAAVENTPSGLIALDESCAALLTMLEAPLPSALGARLTGSLGIALHPDHADSAERLVQCSDSAMHYAKRRGGGQTQMFAPTMHHAAKRELELSKDLHRAIEQGELELHYQPIVDMATGRVLGAEALARWRRPDGSLIPPDEFIPVAERGDLLRPFAEWTIDTVFRQLADWHARHVPVSYLSFNLSAAQLRLNELDELILRHLAETHLPGKSLALEVTEGTLLDNLETVRTRLSRLRAQGVAVAIDDFGIGYASPHYLRMLPVDILKIDQSFLKGVPEEADAASLLNGIIEIGLNLRLKVVTEGVETEEQQAYLASRGVTGGQGYRFSRALPPAQFEAWLGWQSSRAA